MLYPNANTRINIWKASDTSELDILNPHDTVKQLRVEIRIYGKDLTSKNNA